MTQKLILAFDAPITPGRPNGGVILWDEAEQAEIMEVRGRLPGRGSYPAYHEMEARVERDLRTQPGYEEAIVCFVENAATDPRTSAWFGVMAAEPVVEAHKGPYTLVGGESLTIVPPVTMHKCADCAARQVCAINKLVGDLGVALEVGHCSSYC